MISKTKLAAVGIAAAALVGLGVGPAFASTPGGSASVSVGASIGSTIGFGTLPSSVNFGALTPGQTAIANYPVEIIGNTGGYSVTVAANGTALKGTANPNNDQIPNADIFWYPGTAGTIANAWEDLSTTPGVWAENPTTDSNGFPTSGPGTSLIQSVPGGVVSFGNAVNVPGGDAKVPGAFALRVPMGQSPDTYSESVVLTLTGN